jgi:thiol-disulfide isomerase/thioredoxin
MNGVHVIGLILIIALVAGVFVISKDTQKTSAGVTTSDVSLEDVQTKATKGTPFVEIVNPSGFVNTNDQPFQIADYVGKQVILLNVMTYSCINCQRTFPYVNSWYEEYKDDGLVVIGIHTPEFAFEKDKTNVEAEFEKFGITYPTVLDNNYATWRALGNRFWPRKYLIDIHGNIVYDHIGEGAYQETEDQIKKLLRERKAVLGEL